MNDCALSDGRHPRLVKISSRYLPTKYVCFAHPQVSDAELLKVMLEAVFDYKQSHGQNVATDESTSQGVLQVRCGCSAHSPARFIILIMKSIFVAVLSRYKAWNIVHYVSIDCVKLFGIYQHVTIGRSSYGRQAPIVPPAAGAPIPAQDALLFQAEGFFDDDPALP